MIKAYIYDFTKNTVNSPSIYEAYLGLKHLGAELEIIENFKNIPNTQEEKENIAIGGIGFVRERLLQYDIVPPHLDYPEELKPYLGRNIWVSTINQIANDLPNVFVKPKNHQKFFTGKVIKSTKDLIGTGVQGGDYEVYCSDILEMIAEYRVYVRYGKILDIKQYTGDYKARLDFELVEEAISNYKTSPKSYGIDFCVTKQGKTHLIEVNDGYSLGNYGINFINYAKLLYTRWAELTGGKDWFDFAS